MTSKLKCPYCQTELEDAGIHSPELYFCCTNCYMKQKEKDDNYTASPRIWQALIQAKQDLETLKQALEKYADEDMWENCCIWDIEYIQGLFLEHGYKIAKEALERIEHKE